MKKSLLLIVMASIISFSGQAQYINSLTFQHYFTKDQVDSVLNALLGSQATSVLVPEYGVKIYNVQYNTYDADSMPTTASGMLVVPVGVACEVPMLSFGHNNILRKTDAPSYYSMNGQWFICLAAGSMGIITLMPDGVGLGDGPGKHPFLHLQTEATSVIDMIRAVKEVVDTTGTSPNEQLFLSGIAEGAYSAVAAHQYIQTYVDSAEIHVTATGAIAGYYDMGTTMVNMILSDSTYPDPSYLPELVLSYDSIYHFYTNDSDMLAHPYDATIPPLFNGVNRANTVDSHLPSVPKYVLRQDQIDSLQNDSTNFFRVLLEKNNAFNWAPTSPVYLMYCIADEYVPFQNSMVAYNHFVQNGSTMVDTFDVGATDDHATCSQFSVLVAVSLIKQLIHQPLVTNVSATNDTSASVPSGSATAASTQGDPPYTFVWSNNDSTATITGLAAGTYYVTVTDRAHCTNTDSVVIQLVDGINELTLANINVYPNPTQGMLMIENRSTEVLTQIEITDINGNVVNAPYTQNGNMTNINMGEEAKGVYFLTIQSKTGKELHRKVILL